MIERAGSKVCVPFIINQTPAAGGDHCHGPQRAALSGLWAIPSTESWPPTTSGHLQPIFPCVDSRGTHLLWVCVREYGMWYVRGYVLGEEGVNASSLIERNSKLEG